MTKTDSIKIMADLGEGQIVNVVTSGIFGSILNADGTSGCMIGGAFSQLDLIKVMSSCIIGFFQAGTETGLSKAECIEGVRDATVAALRHMAEEEEKQEAKQSFNNDDVENMMDILARKIAEQMKK